MLSYHAFGSVCEKSHTVVALRLCTSACDITNQTDQQTCLHWWCWCASLCTVLPEDTSGSEEENQQYYSPASDLHPRSRRKRTRSKAQGRTSQSLFAVVLSVNHGLVSIHTDAKVSPEEDARRFWSIKPGQITGNCWQREESECELLRIVVVLLGIMMNVY